MVDSQERRERPAPSLYSGFRGNGERVRLRLPFGDQANGWRSVDGSPQASESRPGLCRAHAQTVKKEWAHSAATLEP